MRFKEFLKKTAIEYFIITTCITFFMAAFGTILYPETKFGYDALFSPLLYGLISTIPAILTYVSDEVTAGGYILRKLVHLACIEGLMIFVARMGNMLPGIKEVLILGTCVLCVYIVVNVISWLTLKRTSEKINSGLQRLQEQAGENV